MIPQLATPFPLARLETAQAVQSRDDGRGRDGQETRSAVKARFGGESAEEEEGYSAREDPDLDHPQRMEPSGERSLEDRSDEADEAEEFAGLGGRVGEQVVGHEGEGEFHAAEEEDEDEVGEVQEEMGIGSGWRCLDGAFLLLCMSNGFPICLPTR